MNLAVAVALAYALATYLLLGGIIRYNWDDVWVWAALIALAVFPYRLGVAFKKYLRFDHPISTLLATQVIVLLAIAIVVVVWTAP
jgi:hypothetical protein